MASPKQTLRESLAEVDTRRMIICVFTGFSSGLPLYFIFSLIPAWLYTEKLSLATIGALALIQFPYTWKFLWSPFLDQIQLPFLGLRRGWILVAHIALIALIAWLGQLAPQQDLNVIIIILVLVAFTSATLDIVLDAYRRELLPDIELGIGNAIHVNAYRVAGLVPGGLALVLADHLPWSQVFIITALFMIPGLIMTFMVSEPIHSLRGPRTIQQAFTLPLKEFFQRKGTQAAVLVLAFIFFYKLGDSMATALATPFYLEMGYSKSEIGIIAKNAALWPAVFGGIIGGIWMFKLGINRALWVFGFFQIITIFGFIFVSMMGSAPSSEIRLITLAAVIAMEYFGAGLGTTAFVAYMAKNTHPAYTATQLALFTSLMATPRTFLNATAGTLVEHMGWTNFFYLCILLAIPGMVLLLWVAPWNTRAENEIIGEANIGLPKS